MIIKNKLWAKSKHAPNAVLRETAQTSMVSFQIDGADEATVRLAKQLLAESEIPVGGKNTADYEDALRQVVLDLELIELIEKTFGGRNTVGLFEHFAYFKTLEDAIWFAQQAVYEGFELLRFAVARGEEPEICVLMTHQGLVCDKEVCQRTLVLQCLAKDAGGEYDGWQTTCRENEGVVPAHQVLAEMNRVLH